jgi:hypothetical protein
LNRFGMPLKVFSAAALAFAFAACSSSSGTPTAPPMTDPNLIITTSANGMVGVQTVHLEVAATGSINLSGLGSSGSALGGSAIKLDGSTVSGDVDIQKRALRISASLPTLMGLTADIIQVDGYQYMKYSLGGPKYTKSDIELLATAAPGASMDISKTVDSLKSQLDAAGSKATLVGHDKIDGRDAYHISVTVPTSYINQQLGALGSTTGGMTLDSASLDYWVYSDSTNPAKIDLKASSASIGNVALTVTMTKYNQPVTITAPPASEIQAGS